MPYLLFLLTILISAGALATDFYRWIDKSGAVHYGDHPPSENVRKLEQIKLEANVIDGQASYLISDAVSKNPVVLYGGDCGPLCTNAKALLEKRGIPYTLKEPQKDKADAEALNTLTGALELPVIKIGKTTIKGYEPTQWNAILDEAGYPKSRIPGAYKRVDAKTTDQVKSK